MTITVSFHELAAGLKSLDIRRTAPVAAHASLSAFGIVLGGAASVVGALLSAWDGVLMPAFTYRTMVIPADGPPHNGLVYGASSYQNQSARSWDPDLPADALMGAVAEALRTHRKAHRSAHPILSFSGVGVEALLARQSLEEPLGPLQALADSGGWVLLLGVDHSVNTSLHVAERLAGRRQFVRWALTPSGVVACPNFPGCSNGFIELEEPLAAMARRVTIGQALVQAFPAEALLETARRCFEERPLGYLCKRVDCGRCNAIRSG